MAAGLSIHSNELPRLGSLFSGSSFDRRRHDFLDRPLPSGVRKVKDDAVRIGIFYFVKRVRVGIHTTHEMLASRLFNPFGSFIEVVDPHPEMNESIRGFAR